MRLNADGGRIEQRNGSALHQRTRVPDPMSLNSMLFKRPLPSGITGSGLLG
jgi:hypothetical protein